LPQIGAKATKGLQALRGGVESLLFSLEDLAASHFHQHSDGLSQLPAGSSQHLQPVGRWHEQRDAIVADDADALGKPIKCLEIKSGKIDTLKLLGGIRHEKLLAASS